jgi:hypothetical protein
MEFTIGRTITPSCSRILDYAGYSLDFHVIHGEIGLKGLHDSPSRSWNETAVGQLA